VPEWRNWQTRMVQVHVLARVWGFESLLRHQMNFKALSDPLGAFRFNEQLAKVAAQDQIERTNSVYTAI
jgi:hypothetical protein